MRISDCSADVFSSDLVDQSLEPRPGEDYLRLRVIDDERPFGGREAPADRRHHDARACGAIEKSEIEIAVLADPRDAIALFQTRRDQRRCCTGSQIIEFGIGIDAILFAHRHPIGALGGPMGQKFVERKQLRNVAAHRLSLLESRRLRAIDEKANGSTRSEEHTSELQSLMRISYAVFCLKK